jgi:hypothetical protein
MRLPSKYTFFCSENIISCILLFCIFLTPSCKDNRDNVPSADDKYTTEKQIFRINYGTDPDAEKWYAYNEKGDLVRQGMSVDTIVFDYSTNKIVKRHLDKKHSWQSRIEYMTDATGRIISSISFDEKDKEISKSEFFYDGDGYLIKNTEIVLASGSKYTNEYKYEGGNLKEVKALDMYGKHSSSYVFEYYSDKANDLNLFMQQISDDIFPNGRLGKKNKNMVRQMSNISKEDDTLSLLKYSYTDENNDLILKEFQSDVLNEFDTALTYHFVKHKK